MGLEMVDVLLFTADNISVTTMAREQKHPPVRELGEVDDKYIIGTAEILSFPQKKGMETKTKKCVRNPNEWQEVRHSHIIGEVCENRWRKGLCTL